MSDQKDDDSEQPEYPLVAMLSLCSGMLAHSLVFTSPLPFVAFMVCDFGMSVDVNSAGYWAGFITGGFMIGRTIAGIPWGIASDKFGRRSCLIVSMLNVAIFGIIFGLSTSFTMAVISRFIIGMGNGFMGIAKTSVSEIMKCKEHEVRGFGTLTGFWGLGMIVGPGIGGILSRPAIQYPHLFSADSFFGRFPYALPSIVCSCFALFSALMVYLFLPETAQSLSSSGGNYELIDNSKAEKDESRDDNCSRSVFVVEDEDTDSVDVSNRDDDVENGSIELVPLDSKQKSDVMSVSEPKEEKTLTWTPFSNKPLVLLCAIYMTYCFLVMFLDETMPLWAVSSRSKGGLEWTSAQIGEQLASMGVAIVIFQLFIYERVMKQCCSPNPLATLRRFALCSAVGIALIPLSSIGLDLMTKEAPSNFNSTSHSHEVHNISSFPLIHSIGYYGFSSRMLSENSMLSDQNIPHENSSPSMNEDHQAIFLRVGTWLALVIYRTCAASIFTSMAMILNSSVTREHRGTLNGWVMTFGSIGNSLGPVLGSSLYAWLLDRSWDGRWIFAIETIMFLVLDVVAVVWATVPEPKDHCATPVVDDSANQRE